jgi:hypothetical protein
MAEEISEKASGAEPAEQPKESKSSVGDLDSMLAKIPGLSEYFGAEPTEEPATETEEPSSEEPSTSEEPVVEPEEPAPKEAKQEEEKKQELPAWVQKKVDKLTAQKHEQRERAEALEAKVKELEAKVSQIPPQTPTPDSPLANIDSVEELSRQFEDAKKVKNWALENLDGGEVASKDGTTEYWDGAKVKKYLAWSEALITEHIPARKQYLDSRSTFDAEAAKFYPNISKAGTEENSVLNAWVKIFPAVQKFPDFKLIIMDALAGQKIRLAKAKGPNGQKPLRPTPTLAAPSPSAGAKAPQKNVLSKDLLNRIATDRNALDVFSESLIGSGGS